MPTDIVRKLREQFNHYISKHATVEKFKWIIHKLLSGNRFLIWANLQIVALAVVLPSLASLGACKHIAVIDIAILIATEFVVAYIEPTPKGFVIHYIVFSMRTIHIYFSFLLIVSYLIQKCFVAVS
jgi:hypothetical protein